MNTARTNRSVRSVRSTAASESARIRDKHLSGSSVSSILRPVDGYRGRLKEKGIKPKDHFRENIVAMREKARENRMRKELETLEEQASGSFKMKKFSRVESKVKTMTTARSSGPATDRSSEYLRKNTGKTAAASSKKPVTRFERPPRASAKPSVPKASEVMPLAPRENKDFIKDNYKEAPRAPRRRPSQSSHEGGGKRDGYGEVPKYLQERKELWAEEEARREEEMADECPPGMVLMPEEERLETLAVLKQSMAETNHMLARMPLKIETPGQVRRKAELDAKVKELEDAIDIFSRDQVYVAEDEF